MQEISDLLFNLCPDLYEKIRIKIGAFYETSNLKSFFLKLDKWWNKPVGPELPPVDPYSEGFVDRYKGKNVGTLFDFPYGGVHIYQCENGVLLVDIQNPNNVRFIPTLDIKDEVRGWLSWKAGPSVEDLSPFTEIRDDPAPPVAPPSDDDYSEMGEFLELPAVVFAAFPRINLYNEGLLDEAPPDPVDRYIALCSRKPNS